MSFFRSIFEPEGLVEPIEEGFQTMNLKGYELCYTMSHTINKTEFPTRGKQRYGRQLIFHNCVLVRIFALKYFYLASFIYLNIAEARAKCLPAQEDGQCGRVQIRRV